MRNTLVLGLLLCLPTAALLATASLALLAGKLRRSVSLRSASLRSASRRFPDLPVNEPGREELRDDASSPNSVSTGR
jgi:hypothetical protein